MRMRKLLLGLVVSVVLVFTGNSVSAEESVEGSGLQESIDAIILGSGIDGGDVTGLVELDNLLSE